MEMQDTRQVMREMSMSDDGRCPCCRCVCERCAHTNEGGCCELGCNNPGKSP